MNYEVVVGNIGTVYSGTDADEAKRKYDTYVEKSKNGEGRAAGETVTLLEDGEPITEHDGSDVDDYETPGYAGDVGEDPIDFSEDLPGERGRERWAWAYEELNGAPESEYDR